MNSCFRIPYLKSYLYSSLSFEIQNSTSHFKIRCLLTHFIIKLLSEKRSIISAAQSHCNPLCYFEILKGYLSQLRKQCQLLDLSSVFDKITPQRNYSDSRDRGPGFTFCVSLVLALWFSASNFITLAVSQFPHLKNGIIIVPTTKNCCESQIN